VNKAEKGFALRSIENQVVAAEEFDVSYLQAVFGADHLQAVIGDQSGDGGGSTIGCAPTVRWEILLPRSSATGIRIASPKD